MTGPAATQPSPQPSGPNAGITFDEIEQQLKEAEKTALQPKLDEMKVDGEQVPEALRGKSVSEILAHTRELENALRMSEVSRQQALTTAQLAAQAREVPAAPAEPEPEPLITAEEVATAFQDDPSKGIQLMTKMNEQAINRAASSFAQRIDPLLTGTMGAVEAEAKRKYPDEFELYKDEIKSIIDSLPNKRAMSSINSWDDMIAYVRGKNPDKLFAHRIAKEQAGKAAAAQEDQRNYAGVTMTSQQRAPAPTGQVIMDDTTREVCRVLGISESDYVKWSKVT
jgi:hypothetical protein